MSEPIATYEWPVREMDFDALIHIEVEFLGAEIGRTVVSERVGYRIKPKNPFYLDGKRVLQIRVHEGRLLIEYF